MSSAPPKNFPPTKTRGTEDPPVICKNKKSSSEHSLVHELLKITLNRTSVLHSSLDDIVRLMITWITNIFNWLPVSFVSVLRPCRSWGRFQAIGLCQGWDCNRQAPVLSSLWSNGNVDLGSQGWRFAILVSVYLSGSLAVRTKCLRDDQQRLRFDQRLHLWHTSRSYNAILNLRWSENSKQEDVQPKNMITVLLKGEGSRDNDLIVFDGLWS